MNSLIPVKTVKALLAINQRTHDDLLPEQRTLLLLINGKTSAAALEKDFSFIASMKKDASLIGDVAAMLARLHQSGFIEFAENKTEADALVVTAQEHYGLLLLQKNPSNPPSSASGSPAAAKTAASRPAGPSPQPPAPTAADPQIERAKEELTSFLKALMGDDYSLIAEKIAGCNNRERFSTILHGLEDVIQNYGSRKSAEKLKTQFKEFY